MTAPHNTAELVRAVTAELARLTTEKASPREIEKARAGAAKK